MMLDVMLRAVPTMPIPLASHGQLIPSPPGFFTPGDERRRVPPAAQCLHGVATLVTRCV